MPNIAISKPDICKGCPLYDNLDYVPFSCTCDPCNDQVAKDIKELTDANTRPCEANMLLVGIAPSYQEVANGKPLVGPAGRKVDAAIKWALATLKRVETELTVRKTNLVRCRTTQPGKKGIVNRDPTKNEIAHCTSRHLINELSLPNVKVIVPLGELVHGVLCSAKFKQCVGSRIKYGTTRIRAHLQVLWDKQKV